MLGGESKGIERHLMKHVDAFLTIKPFADTTAVGLDSLNVSVASALILSKVMERPGRDTISRLRKTFGTARQSKLTGATGPASKDARDEEGDFMMWSAPL
jgi:hypothetical protein